MNSLDKFEYINRLTIPYKDIFTTVYTVRTDNGILIFDSGSFDEDIENSIIPFFNSLGISADEIKYVFISHNHRDHAGGLEAFMRKFPDVCIVSRSPELKEKFSGFKIISPEDGDILLDVLEVVAIPGHTKDSSAVLDKRTNTLISGDCLQLYGIFGSGKWGANISFPKKHLEAINKLRGMDIEIILTAHDYCPLGYIYSGKVEVKEALDACVAPLFEIVNLISENKEFSDEAICSMYNNGNKPVLRDGVVTAVRKMIEVSEE